MSSSELSQDIMLLACIRDVPRSNVSRNTDCSVWGHSWFLYYNIRRYIVWASESVGKQAVSFSGRTELHKVIIL
jgi:hypothetical protein